MPQTFPPTNFMVTCSVYTRVKSVKLYEMVLFKYLRSGQLCAHASFNKMPVFRFFTQPAAKGFTAEILRFSTYTIKIYGTAKYVSSSPNLRVDMK